jgi:Domain of unknown function (DUF4410)
MMTTTKNGWLSVAAVVAMLSLAGCPSHSSQDSAKQSASSPPVPSVILVYRFHIPSDLSMERFSTGTSALGHDTVGERQLALADEIQEAVAKALVDRINALGLPAKLSSGTLKLKPPPDCLIVQGIFTSRDQLFPGHRNAIAYMSGQSLVSTQGTVSQLVKNKSIVVLTFTTSTQSAPMPDALVNVKAGATNAASGGSDPAHAAVAHYAPLIDQLANTTADQASAQLGQYFVKQGWISADKVKSQPAPSP